jgi:ubiquitin-conjugating enzyme E2 J1
MSSSNKKYNMSHSAIKRIMSEIQELQRNPSNEYVAYPLSEDNLFEWHFTVRGPSGTAFEGGLYHGRIILPAEYPYKPPDIMLLTPNGRFEVNKKICLSISSYHPESWMPAWGIRTALLALIGFFPISAQGIGAIEYPDDMRRDLAVKSLDFKCSTCGRVNREALPPISESSKGSNLANSGNNEDGTNICDHVNKDTSFGNEKELRADVSTSNASVHAEEVIKSEKFGRNEKEEQNNQKLLESVSPKGLQENRENTTTTTTRMTTNIMTSPKPKKESGIGVLFLNLLIFLIAAAIGYIMYHKASRVIFRQ